MHPALSIVFFTTASGAGFALCPARARRPNRPVAPTPWFGFVGLAVALALAVGGLVSSAFHLGRPERPSRLFAMALVMAVPRRRPVGADLHFGRGVRDRLGVFRRHDGVIGLCGVVAAFLALGTIYCTEMTIGR